MSPATGRMPPSSPVRVGAMELPTIRYGTRIHRSAPVRMAREASTQRSSQYRRRLFLIPFLVSLLPRFLLEESDVGDFLAQKPAIFLRGSPHFREGVGRRGGWILSRRGSMGAPPCDLDSP